MRVFKLTTEAGRYSNLAFARDEDAKLYDLFDGSSVLRRWIAVPVVPAEDDPADAELADFALLGTIPVFSDRAAQALREVLHRHGELLSLLSDWGTFFAFNLKVVRDALDEEQSEVSRFTSGEVMSINRFAFRPRVIDDVELFKIPQKPRSFILVTDRFVQRVREAQLTGFEFTEVWHDKESVDHS